MLSSNRRGGAFVPHDIAHPIKGAAAGPLAGLTVAVKDMYDVGGERTGGGNPRWLDTHRPADAPPRKSIQARMFAFFA